MCVVATLRAGKIPTAGSEDQRVRRNAAAMSDIVFHKSGSLKVSTKTVASFMSRPEVREMSRLEVWYDAIVDLDPRTNTDRSMFSDMLYNVRGFLDAHIVSGGNIDDETSNAVRAALTALVGSKDDMKGKVGA